MLVQEEMPWNNMSIHPLGNKEIYSRLHGNLASSLGNNVLCTNRLGR